MRIILIQIFTKIVQNIHYGHWLLHQNGAFQILDDSFAPFWCIRGRFLDFGDSLHHFGDGVAQLWCKERKLYHNFLFTIPK
jgi:hypothetical protein